MCSEFVHVTVSYEPGLFKVFVTRSLVGYVGDSNTSICRHICISSSVVSGQLKKSTSRVLLGTWSVVCRVTLERLAVTHLVSSFPP